MLAYIINEEKDHNNILVQYIHYKPTLCCQSARCCVTVEQDSININAIIEMAWCDKTSFDSIKEQTGMLEKEVIKIRRSNLKISSFKVWRERVYGRKAKHEKI